MKSRIVMTRQKKKKKKKEREKKRRSRISHLDNLLARPTAWYFGFASTIEEVTHRPVVFIPALERVVVPAKSLSALFVYLHELSRLATKSRLDINKGCKTNV